LVLSAINGFFRSQAFPELRDLLVMAAFRVSRARRIFLGDRSLSLEMNGNDSRVTSGARQRLQPLLLIFSTIPALR